MNYQELATAWAEKYGIVNFRVEGKIMIYNKSYPATMFEPRKTFQHRVDLSTGKDIVVQLKRFVPKGYQNV